jgi:hypothetical protein
MSALVKADICSAPTHVRFKPESGHCAANPKSAFGCRLMSTRPRYRSSLAELESQESMSLIRVLLRPTKMGRCTGMLYFDGANLDLCCYSTR